MTMPTMQEIDRIEVEIKSCLNQLFAIHPELALDLCAAARRGVEADALIYAAKVAIPDAEHPVDESISNWAWQIRNLGADRRLEKKRAEKAEAELAALKVERDSMQAKIDALMLEYCPDEMTPEQVEEWGKHQKPSPNQGDSNEH